MTKLQEALRKKYGSPQAAIRALGLSVDLIEGPRMACDEAQTGLRQMLVALRTKTKKPKLAADAQTTSYNQRWPEAARIKRGTSFG